MAEAQGLLHPARAFIEIPVERSLRLAQIEKAMPNAAPTIGGQENALSAIENPLQCDPTLGKGRAEIPLGEDFWVEPNDELLMRVERLFRRPSCIRLA